MSVGQSEDEFHVDSPALRAFIAEVRTIVPRATSPGEAVVALRGGAKQVAGPAAHVEHPSPVEITGKRQHAYDEFGTEPAAPRQTLVTEADLGVRQFVAGLQHGECLGARADSVRPTICPSR